MGMQGLVHTDNMGVKKCNLSKS